MTWPTTLLLPSSDLKHDAKHENLKHNRELLPKEKHPESPISSPDYPSLSDDSDELELQHGIV
jgi:hypothetical protein